MITISCTKKLFAASSFVEEPHNELEDELYKWHANVFRIARKNNLIIMNNKTRYCFILFGIRKEHYRNFKEIFLQALMENLKAEGISERLINNYIRHANSITFTKTYDRSVIGSMIDMVKMIEFTIEDYLPIQEMNIIELNERCNATPVLKLKKFPNEFMKELLNR